MVMLAVWAWQLRRGVHTEVFVRSARLALVILVPAILFTMLAGDELGVIEARYQPMKTVPAEAQWPACQPCSFSLFHIGGGNDHTPTRIGIEATHVRPASPITTAPAARRPSTTLIDKRAHLT